MSEKKLEVLYSAPARRLCPICGKVAYSLSGEHPQCAQTRADAVFKARQKRKNDRYRVAPPVSLRSNAPSQAQ